MSRQYDKKISRGYVQFIYPEITFRISKKYTISILIKKNISRNLKNIGSIVNTVCTFLEQCTGVCIGEFSFKFSNIQGVVYIPSESISTRYASLQTLKDLKLISSYYTTDIQNFISCSIDEPKISFQIWDTSIRFVVSSFIDLKYIIKFAKNHFQSS